MPDTPPPQAVDYSGRPLQVDDTIAFVSNDPIGLVSGRIVLIHDRQIVVESGHLCIVPADSGLFAAPKTQAAKYSRIALHPAQDGA
jgi:hypothetical protein